MKFHKTSQYSTIYILDSRSQFFELKHIINLEKDLILTFDFGLNHEVNKLGGKIEYFDALGEIDDMEINNKIVNNFLTSWYFDKNGNDIFKFKGVNFGDSFKMNLIHEIVGITKISFSLEKISQLSYKSIIVGTSNQMIYTLLNFFEIEYTQINSTKSEKITSFYYFPISKWMSDRIHPKGLRKIKSAIYQKISQTFNWLNVTLHSPIGTTDNFAVFVHKYYPTYPIISRLHKDKDLNIVLENFSRPIELLKKTNERTIPVKYSRKELKVSTRNLLSNFTKKKQTKLVISTGKDISDIAYDIINDTLKAEIYLHLKFLSSCIEYIKTNKLNLIILIANIGLMPTLLHAVCKKNSIPSYLIINGLLINNFETESKDANFINAYSASIKKSYFNNQKNVEILGDPRMDKYGKSPKNTINRKLPRIVIGASGFNSSDLNSYQAVEFDFIFQILKTFMVLKEKGYEFEIHIKIRSNGYHTQYKNFINEYFKLMRVGIIRNVPMYNVLSKCDFYISTCSQTLFEASALGIPVVYFKNDREVLNEPFNGGEDLVTVQSSFELEKAFTDFINFHPKFDRLLERKTLE